MLNILKEDKSIPYENLLKTDIALWQMDAS